MHHASPTPAPAAPVSSASSSPAASTPALQLKSRLRGAAYADQIQMLAPRAPVQQRRVVQKSEPNMSMADGSVSDGSASYPPPGQSSSGPASPRPQNAEPERNQGADGGTNGPNRSVEMPGVNVPVTPELAQEREGALRQVVFAVNEANALLDAYSAWLRANWTEYNRYTSGATASVGWDNNDFRIFLNGKLQSNVTSAAGAFTTALLAALEIGGGPLGYVLGLAANKGASALARLLAAPTVSREDRNRNLGRNEMGAATSASNALIDGEVAEIRAGIAGRNTRWSGATQRLSTPEQVAEFRNAMLAEQRGLEQRAAGLRGNDLSLAQNMIRDWTLANAGGAERARPGVNEAQWDAAAQRGFPGERGIEGHYEAWVHGVRRELVAHNVATSLADRLAQECDQVARAERGGGAAAMASAVMLRFQGVLRPLPTVPHAGRLFVGFWDHTAWWEARDVTQPEMSIHLRNDHGAVVLDRTEFWGRISQGHVPGFGGRVRLGWVTSWTHRDPPTFAL